VLPGRMDPGAGTSGGGLLLPRSNSPSPGRDAIYLPGGRLCGKDTDFSGGDPPRPVFRNPDFSQEHCGFCVRISGVDQRTQGKGEKLPGADLQGNADRSSKEGLACTWPVGTRRGLGLGRRCPDRLYMPFIDKALSATIPDGAVGEKLLRFFPEKSGVLKFLSQRIPQRALRRIMIRLFYLSVTINGLKFRPCGKTVRSRHRWRKPRFERPITIPYPGPGGRRPRFITGRDF